jgi:hypothetical protein
MREAKLAARSREVHRGTSAEFGRRCTPGEETVNSLPQWHPPCCSRSISVPDEPRWSTMEKLPAKGHVTSAWACVAS